MHNYTITREDFENFGITVSEAEFPALIEHTNDTLEERIGVAITESLDDEELEALASFQETATDEQLAEWVTKNVPELKEIVQDEVDILLGEIAKHHKELS